MQKEWYCFMVNGAFHHMNTKAVADQLASIFGKDLIEMKVVCNEDMIASTGEYYVFIRCTNYSKYIETLKRKAVFLSAVSSFDSPAIFTDKDVRDFAGSAAEGQKPDGLKRGDVVLVKDGYLKNLYGIVRDAAGGKFRVAFSLHLRKFFEILAETSLQVIGNILDKNICMSQLDQKQEVIELDKRNKLRRKSRRKLAGKKRRG